MNAPRLFLLAIVVAGLSAGGCARIERRITITSDPSGAIVSLNDTEVGRTPVEVDFTYFGVYDVRLRKEGFEPIVTTAEAKAPLHEQPVIDLVAMMFPATLKTRIDWHYTLELADTDESGLLQRAAELRTQLDPPPASEEDSSD
jgi:hypothetical protein